jgi:hypothetical protein
MRRHVESAQRHEAAAALWDTRHEVGRAQFERRCGRIEREAARLDGDRAELERLRATGLARRDTALRAKIDSLAGEVERRSAQLQSDDAALEQERARLWAHRDRREHPRSAPAAKARTRREAVAREPEYRASGGVDDGLRAARRVVAQMRENARHLSSILTQMADVLETSAALAQANAKRLERIGRADAGAEEGRAADRGYAAARCARRNAEMARVRSGPGAVDDDA